MPTHQSWAFHWIVPDSVADDEVESWAKREWAVEVAERAKGQPQVTLLLASVPPAPPGLRRPPRIVRVVGDVT